MAFDATRPVPVTVTPPDGPLGFWEAYRAARRNVLELIPAAAYRETMLSGGRAGWVMVMEPTVLEHILKTAEADYPKTALLKRLMQPRQGQNLIIAEGEDWRRQRRVMAPAFQPRVLAAQVPAMLDAAAAATTRLGEETGAEARAPAVRPGAAVDVFPHMVTATSDVMCDLVLSARDAFDRAALTAAVDAYVENIGRISLLDLLGVPNWVPRPGALRDRSRVRMDRLADRLIAEREGTAGGRSDFLDLLLTAHDPRTGRGMDPLEVRNNLLGFLFAGQETSALALTWALYLLAFDPAAQDRARAEIAQAGALRTLEDLDRLEYVGRVIDEALRLYPPAGFTVRRATKDADLAGHKIRAGATVILPVYALHRHAALWEAPDAFDPDRFLPERAATRHRYAYLPFGAGPRICIGMSFALIEARAILATLLSRFRFALPPGAEPEPQMWFTLRPAGGMPLHVTPDPV